MRPLPEEQLLRLEQQVDHLPGEREKLFNLLRNASAQGQRDRVLFLRKAACGV
jgi:hypothetical protein